MTPTVPNDAYSYNTMRTDPVPVYPLSAYLVELVDAEDAPRVLAVAAGLLAEAGGHAGIAQRQLLGVEPVVAVEAADGLL